MKGRFLDYATNIRRASGSVQACFMLYSQFFMAVSAQCGRYKPHREPDVIRQLLVCFHS